ncbi:MAG TPA: DUF1223 domain-containing protein [Vicinamibacterales bacterium]
MITRGAFAVSVGAVLCVAWLRAGAPPAPAREHTGPRTPVVVELFTSEGCSSCPPADRLLATLAATQPVEGAEVIPLGLHVDYWDQLGWRDRFSSGAVTNRQRVYSRVFNIDSIYTPQLVVDGRAEVVGSDASGARRAIEHALDTPHGQLQVELEPSGADGVALAVSASDLPQTPRGDRDELVVAITEDQLKSDVRRGENHGRVLTHVAVVRSLVTGEAKPGDGPIRFAVPRLPIGADWNRDNLKIVTFVQEARSRRIVAAAWRPVPSGHR